MPVEWSKYICHLNSTKTTKANLIVARLEYVTYHCSQLWFANEVKDTYAAFCRRYGNISSGAAGEHYCWNEEIVQGMTEDLSRPWERLRNAINEFFRKRNSAVGRSFDEAIGPLEVAHGIIHEFPSSEPD